MPQTLSDAQIAELLANAPSYRTKGTVCAIRADEDSTWTTGNGDVLHAVAGDWWVIDGDDRWSVSKDVFAQTYRNLGGDRFQKVAIITATRIETDFAVETLEGQATGRRGDWLVRNPSGECWPVKTDTFTERYEEA